MESLSWHFYFLFWVGSSSSESCIMILWVVAVFCNNKNNKSGCVFVLLLLYCLYSSYFLQCHGADPPSPDLDGPTTRTRSKVIILSILFGCLTGLGCALVCACLLRCIFTYIKRVPILKGPVVFSPNISPKSLQSALVSNNQTLTLLPNGNYYKTLPDNGLTFAVKKLEHPPFQNEPKNKKRRMQKELEILGSLSHRHLMSLRAYVVSDSRFCLVYDYVPTGSLEDAIRKRRDNELQIGWDARLRIAVGIIKGLQYLHFSCTPSICHYNLKPSNVMLDADFEPRLTDCGLAMIMHSFNSSSPYYFAPECFPNFNMHTEKSDIFSFGVLLGILLTGRDPSDPLFGEATSGSRGDMGMWFRHLVETGDAREALDKSLLGQEMEEDEMLMAVRIAAVCLSDIPADRPSSDELVPMLTQLHSV